MSVLTSALKSNYLFSSLSKKQLQSLEKHARYKHLNPGEVLFSLTDEANYFWWLERGRIKLYRLSRDGDQKIMGMVEPSQSFAEGVLFMEDPVYPVNAEALMESVVIGFDRNAYLEVLQASFQTCLGLFRQMVKRTKRHLDEIEALTIQNARYRIVHYLLRLQDSSNGEPVLIKLPVSKQLIASQLAMRPETLSRLFRELEKEHLISVKGNTVEITNRIALESLP